MAPGEDELMGEIAEMMLDGTMCECCGVWHDDILANVEGGDKDGKGGTVEFTPQGYPWTCSDCRG